MKTAVIFFRSQEEVFDGKYYELVMEAFDGGGLKADTIEVLFDSDEMGFKHRLDEFISSYDNLIVIGGDYLDFDFNKIIAETLNNPFVENESAKGFLDAVSKSEGKYYPDEYAFMPCDCTVIPNIHGAFQGYITDYNQLTFAVLPTDLTQVKLMFDSYLLPYLEKKYNLQRKRITLKYFGSDTEIKKTIEEAENIGEGFKWNIYDNNGDKTLELLFDNVPEELRNDAIRYIVSNHKDEIYANFDTTLEERIFDLLKLKNQKLSVAESFTSGRVVSSIVKNSGSSQYVHEGIVAYSNESKMKRLGVSEYDLSRYGAVSSVVAYQMCAGLLKHGGCDIAIATTGIAGPNSDSSEKPVGLCYIAVGMRDGVHTYKYNFKGTREEITEQGKNTALFLGIKRLKELNLV